MNVEERMRLIHAELAELAKIYIQTIVKEYGKYIPKGKLEELQSLTDYKKIIFIKSYGSINGFARKEGVFVPFDAYSVFKQVENFKEYGSNKEHILCDRENLILNDNTFYDYVEHLVLKGCSVEDYYKDLLLHEVMHFCGSGGASALKEGINEYLTRKLAKEKGFQTSGCGYPKETKIAYQLEKIFGEDILNQIAFINDEDKILAFLEEKLGKEAKVFYSQLSKEMEKEFREKYYINMDDYGGLKGVNKKIENYKKIDYKKANELMNNYQKKNTKR